MQIINNKLIFNIKRSESIDTIISLGTVGEFKISDFDVIKSDVKALNNIDGNIIYSPVLILNGEELSFSIPSSITEKLPNKSYFDIKGNIGDTTIILLEGEINISNNVTKVWI
ncbi:hypothetical protein P872_18425 [Rhodonellum psychrophilum GCM71 = DSM 17998]|uniref:Uncharacterized protein n=2 Tax=Rhodonellum TaxID=336827 RepID=U5BXT9_9BACT|nr:MULTISPECIES: hypothetical protein [Rhodonellum]ERM82374.1 hypothetical protein P872_18425 [Rhodonellum psychrophilum GCM71 = DSM 17998]SDZ35383.1 hypothetical protein SAMN05444412_11140 [Rhodonellum ikkaensis]